MVRVLQLDCSAESGRASGAVRNISKQQLTDVRLRITWRNEQGKSVAQTSARPATLPLAPGKSSKFSAKAEVPVEARKCDVEIVRAG